MAGLDTDSFVAVITGDIVGSRKLSDSARQQLAETLRTIANEAREQFRDVVPLEIDIFRGDSWQLLVTEPGRALRIALYIRARLRASFPDEDDKVDTRAAIGVGDVTVFPKERVSEGDGPAFVASGRALEELKKIRLGFEFPETTVRFRGSLRTISALIDSLASEWTAKQALAVSGALRGLTQENIRDLWDPPIKSQSVIARHLERAGWDSIRLAVEFVEQAV